MTINEQLDRLGFSSKEASIYISILENASISATDIAEITGLQRTTVYSALQRILKIGLVVEELGGPKRLYRPGPSEALRNLYTAELEDLQKKQEIVEDAILAVKEVEVDSGYNPPKLRVVHSDHMESFLHAQTPIWINSIMQGDGTWWGFQDHLFAEKYESWIDWFWTQTPDDLELRLLSNKSDIEESMKKKKLNKRIIHYWTGDDFSGTVWVNGDYVVTVSLQQEPQSIVQIHDVLLASNLRNVFKRLWDLETDTQ